MRSLRFDVQEVREKIHRLVEKETRVHRHGLMDVRLESHVSQNITVDIDARRHLDQLEPVLGQLEHAALGYVDDGLRTLGGILARECHLLDLLHEFARAALIDDSKLAVFDRDFEPAGGERTGEDDGAGVL